MSVYYKERPQYLEKSLESIVNQTVKPNEIVIVKDGKLTKELEKVLNKYKAEFPELVQIYQLQNNNRIRTSIKIWSRKM